MLVCGFLSLSLHPSFQKNSEETQLLGMFFGSGKSNKRPGNIRLKKRETVVIAKAQFYFLFLSSAKLAEVVLSQIPHVGTELMRTKLT